MEQKNEVKHYIYLGGKFYDNYMYFDLNVDEHYVADSLFYKREIPVKFKDEMVRDGDKYRAIFCKVRKKYKQKFEEALEELKTKMALLGHLDYEDFCYDMLKKLEEL